MSIQPQIPGYDLSAVYDGQQFSLQQLLKSLSWEESLDDGPVKLSAELRAEEDVAAILRGSQGLFLTGRSFGQSDPAELWRGIAWDVRSKEARSPTVTLTANDHLIYPVKNQDDFLYEPTTATAIVRDSAGQWQIPMSSLADTGMTLKRQIQRGATLWKLWTDAIKETAKKGAGLYRVRMTAGQLELVPLGSNSTVWLLEIGVNLYDAERLWTREGEVTKAKVMGSANSDTEPRPVLAVAQDDALITQDGILQKVLSDTDTKTAGDAQVLGKQALRGPEESVTLTAPDINTLRAGDTVVVRDRTGTDYSLLVDHVTHNGSKGVGSMDLTLTTEQQIRWRWVTA